VTPLHAEYWGCLLLLAEHELEALHLQDEAAKRGLRLTESAAVGGSAVPAVRAVGAPLPGQSGVGTGVHAAVQREIEALLAGEPLQCRCSCNIDAVLHMMHDRCGCVDVFRVEQPAFHDKLNQT
jgi:hypothetical protein